jgi:hypothetical protein
MTTTLSLLKRPALLSLRPEPPPSSRREAADGQKRAAAHSRSGPNPDLAGRPRLNYAATVPVTSYETMGWLRAAVGIALTAAPGVPMRLAGQPEPTGADMLLMRTIGIRDLVLGLGTVAAARSGDVRDVRRWTTAALASDSLDSAASLAGLRSIGKRDSLSAAVLALAFVCGDLQARRRIPAAPRSVAEVTAGVE